MIKKSIALIFASFFIFYGCKTDSLEVLGDSTANTVEGPTLFTLLPKEETNVDFENTLKEGLNANVLVYEYLYNGGGVATGDFNNDGQQDLYFTSNMGENKFYLNTGNLSFKDVTNISKVNGRPGPWKTGITAADVNGDGLLDLYLCYSGALPDSKRKNQLFINTGNDANMVPIFEEKAEEFGLASAAYSNQGYFFDYDNDGDLDMLLLNHNPKSLPVLNEVSTKEFLKKDDTLQGTRLFEQKNGKFFDVTVASGISGSALTYGLGMGISDVNNDGWQDFYISNDYTVPDYLYINNKNKTFTDQLGNQMGHISHFSMGNTIADINNDGWQDIFTLDMLPEDNKRQKLLVAPDNYEKFDLNLRSGFHHQYMRNMLQLNNGNDTYSEIGQFSGISKTDWSWAPLFADFDNDGHKDLFVTNGYFRDYTNLDFINYMEDFVQSKGRLQRQDVLDLIEKMPSSDLTNYYFSNTGNLIFENTTRTAGVNQPANSNGAVYVDLDNDGDLDLVVNNINKPAFIYRNDTDTESKNYLNIALEGAQQNTQGIGSKVTLYAQGELQVFEQMPTQGYLSTVSNELHFGLSNKTIIDSLTVKWPTGTLQTIYDIQTNQKIILKEEDGSKNTPNEVVGKSIFEPSTAPINYVHKASPLNDFKRQPLLLKQLSHQAPSIKKADLNNDGREDIVLAGGIGQATAVYLQMADGSFEKKAGASFELDKNSFDSDLAIFDVNNDGKLDIYVASGGYHEFAPIDSILQDRLYFGDGTGNFIKNLDALPIMHTSTGTVAFSDINQDSFLDVFVGGQVIPGRYPESPRSYILINDGMGNFKDETENIQPQLKQPGMVTDAKWADLNGDKRDDLIILGQWMPISIYSNKGGELVNETSSYFKNEHYGLWNSLNIADINDDGILDILAGNIGENSPLGISPETPAELYYSDFDNNGAVDPILNYYVNNKSYPALTRAELLGQLTYLRQKFNSYESYSEASLTDIFTDENLTNADKLVATEEKSMLFLGTQNRKFKKAKLPKEAQFAPVTDAVIEDFNSDGHKDILLFGNDAFYKLSLGKFDANYGTLLLGNGTGQFDYVPQAKSGLSVGGSLTNALWLNNKLLITTYGEPLQIYLMAN